LSASYGQIASALQQVSEASLGSSEKIALLEQAAATEAQAIEQIEQLADRLGQPAAALTA
jgi:methyl-accepting chemotaxis protein